MSTTLTPARFAIFLVIFGKKVSSLSITADNIKIHSKDNNSISFDDVIDLELSRGLFHSSISIHITDVDSYKFCGFNEKSAESFRISLKDRIQLHINERAEKDNVMLRRACEKYKKGCGRNKFLSYKKYTETIPDTPPITWWQEINEKLFTINTAFKNIAEKTADLQQTPELYRKYKNRRFINSELIKEREFFDQVEDDKLTRKQRLAVLTDEDTTLVLAGAGSGKTSVIVAKIGYLLKKSMCDANEILVLAFNKDAVKEVKKRIKKNLSTYTSDLEVDCRTFHGLGRYITLNAQPTTKMPIAEEAKEEQVKFERLKSIMLDFAKEPEFLNIMVKYFASFFAEYKSELEFSSDREYRYEVRI